MTKRKMEKDSKSHYRTEIFVLCCFLVLPFSVFGVGAVSHIVEHDFFVTQRIANVNHAFVSEMQSALDNTREAAKDSVLLDAIANNDADAAKSELEQLIKKYGLSTIVAVNSEGIALARTPSSQKNDFVFLSTSWGQQAALGKETVMVGAGRSFPFIITSAVPIVTDGAVEGAVFGGQILDGAYAKAFRDKYLKQNEHVAFYSTETGMYGTSFDNEETNRLFRLLFADGSEAIQGADAGLIAGHFNVGGTIYHVANISLTGNDGKKIGGIFVLTSAYAYVHPLVAGAAGLMLLALLFLHVLKKHKKKTEQGIILAIGILLVATGILFSVKTIHALLYANPSPYTIYNSTMGLKPDADIFSGLGEQKIAIHIATGGEAINAAQATVTFDPTIVRVENIVLDNSFCDPNLLLENTIDNVLGTATIACIKAQGTSANHATLAELLVQPLRYGAATLHFADDAKVLANDGLGTNVLRQVTDGSYQFVAPSESGGSVALFSSSHPNPTRWYNNRNVHIVWVNPNASKLYAYAFDDQPNTVPDKIQTSTETSRDFSVTHDGTYYFHLTALNTGAAEETSHLKILVDIAPPELPEILLSATEINVGDMLRIELRDHGDAMSGLQKNYYVSFDGGIWLPVTSHVAMPFYDKGAHKISLRVFDNAGNYRDVSTEVTVK